MSLINEALKKAQREREGQIKPDFKSALPGVEAQYGNPSQSPTFKAVTGAVRFGLVAALIVCVAVITYFLTRNNTEAAPAQDKGPEYVSIDLRDREAGALPVSEATESAVSKPLPVAPPTVAPPLESVAAAATLPEDNGPVLSKPVETVVSLPPAITTDVPSEQLAMVDLPQPPAPEPETTAPQTPAQPVLTGERQPQPEEVPLPEANIEVPPNPLVLDFLEKSRITGVKVSGSRSRLLMNNQVFKLGSVVDPKLSLRVSNILENEVHFVDESGAEYRKQFRR